MKICGYDYTFEHLHHSQFVEGGWSRYVMSLLLASNILLDSEYASAIKAQQTDVTCSFLLIEHSDSRGVREIALQTFRLWFLIWCIPVFVGSFSEAPIPQPYLFQVWPAMKTNKTPTHSFLLIRLSKICPRLFYSILVVIKDPLILNADVCKDLM